MKAWKKLREELLKDKGVKKEYDRLKPYYELVGQLVEARSKKGLTQKQLAEKIGTKQSAIARLESGNANPSLLFLEKIVGAMGYKLNIQIK